jgi:uncharacterized SAM-binding protein YcdF (DUF218 family)
MIASMIARIPPPPDPDHYAVKSNGQISKSLLILLILLTILLGGYLILKAAGGLLIIADPLKKADAAVVLSGDDGDRLAEAIQLFKDEYVNKIFFTYTDETAVRNLMSTAARDGIPYKKMFVTKMEVSNTWDEARAILQLSQQKGISSIIVITDPFHTFRARLYFRKVFSGSGINVAVRPVRDNWYKSSTWWRSREGIQYTLQEYLKIFMFIFGVH